MLPMTSRESFKAHPRICISYEASSMFSPRLVHVAIFNFLGFWPPRLCSVLLYKSWQHFGWEDEDVLGRGPSLLGRTPLSGT